MHPLEANTSNKFKAPSSLAKKSLAKKSLAKKSLSKKSRLAKKSLSKKSLAKKSLLAKKSIIAKKSLAKKSLIANRFANQQENKKGKKNSNNYTGGGLGQLDHFVVNGVSKPLNQRPRRLDPLKPITQPGVYDYTTDNSPVERILVYSDQEGGNPFKIHGDGDPSLTRENGIISDIADEIALVFLGDLQDNSNWSIRLMLAMNNLKSGQSGHKDRVVLCAGNRDVNKVRFADELCIDPAPDWSMSFSEIVNNVYNAWVDGDGDGDGDDDDNKGTRYHWKYKAEELVNVLDIQQWNNKREELLTIFRESRILNTKGDDDNSNITPPPFARLCVLFTAGDNKNGDGVDLMFKELKELKLLNDDDRNDDRKFKCIAFAVMNMLMSRNNQSQKMNTELKKYNALYLEYLKNCNLCALVKTRQGNVFASHSGVNPLKSPSIYNIMGLVSILTPDDPQEGVHQESKLDEVVSSMNEKWVKGINEVMNIGEDKLFRDNYLVQYMIHMSANSDVTGFKSPDTGETFDYNSNAGFVNQAPKDFLDPRARAVGPSAKLKMLRGGWYTQYTNPQHHTTQQHTTQQPITSSQQPITSSYQRTNQYTEQRTHQPTHQPTYSTSLTKPSSPTHQPTYSTSLTKPSSPTQQPTNTHVLNNKLWAKEFSNKDAHLKNTLFVPLSSDSSRGTMKFHIFGHQSRGAVPIARLVNGTYHIDMDISKLEGQTNNLSYAVLMIHNKEDGGARVIGRMVFQTHNNLNGYFVHPKCSQRTKNYINGLRNEDESLIMNYNTDLKDLEALQCTYKNAQIMVKIEEDEDIIIAYDLFQDAEGKFHNNYYFIPKHAIVNHDGISVMIDTEKKIPIIDYSFEDVRKEESSVSSVQ
jgi:hypothetical protein